jgi:hypothetical protein
MFPFHIWILCFYVMLLQLKKSFEHSLNDLPLALQFSSVKIGFPFSIQIISSKVYILSLEYLKIT